MRVTAIATEIDIKAAVDKLPADVRRLAATADVALGKLTVAALDMKLAASRLSTMERLQLKIGLDRAGLLAN